TAHGSTSGGSRTSRSVSTDAQVSRVSTNVVHNPVQRRPFERARLWIDLWVTGRRKVVGRKPLWRHHETDYESPHVLRTAPSQGQPGPGIEVRRTGRNAVWIVLWRGDSTGAVPDGTEVDKGTDRGPNRTRGPGNRESGRPHVGAEQPSQPGNRR